MERTATSLAASSRLLTFQDAPQAWTAGVSFITKICISPLEFPVVRRPGGEPLAPGIDHGLGGLAVGDVPVAILVFASVGTTAHNTIAEAPVSEFDSICSSCAVKFSTQPVLSLNTDGGWGTE